MMGKNNVTPDASSGATYLLPQHEANHSNGIETNVIFCSKKKMDETRSDLYICQDPWIRI
jgi:hypothetical protein